MASPTNKASAGRGYPPSEGGLVLFCPPVARLAGQQIIGAPPGPPFCASRRCRGVSKRCGVKALAGSGGRPAQGFVKGDGWSATARGSCSRFMNHRPPHAGTQGLPDMRGGMCPSSTFGGRVPPDHQVRSKRLATGGARFHTFHSSGRRRRIMTQQENTHCRILLITNI